MDQANCYIFYADMEKETYFPKGKKAFREGLSLRKLNRTLPFPGGKMQVYFALLPQYYGKNKKPWKQEKASMLIQGAAREAGARQTCRDFLLGNSLGELLHYQEKEREMPWELQAACLYAQKPFESVQVSFQKEGGQWEADRVMRLLEPYLSRLHSVILIGEESVASEILEERLYQEYGMLMLRNSRQTENLPWLDLSGKATEDEPFFTKENRNKRIDDKELLKFLDTVIKNGYNTKVN